VFLEEEEEEEEVEEKSTNLNGDFRSLFGVDLIRQFCRLRFQRRISCEFLQRLLNEGKVH